MAENFELIRLEIINNRLDSEDRKQRLEEFVIKPLRRIGGPMFDDLQKRLDKLEADLAKACMSIPAAKGFESGDGFAGTLLTGKEHNDEFYIDPVTGATRTRTNRSGGIQGGISNGEIIEIKVAFKPTSTIGQAQVRWR